MKAQDISYPPETAVPAIEPSAPFASRAVRVMNLSLTHCFKALGPLRAEVEEYEHSVWSASRTAVCTPSAALTGAIMTHYTNQTFLPIVLEWFNSQLPSFVVFFFFRGTCERCPLIFRKAHFSLCSLEWEWQRGSAVVERNLLGRRRRQSEWGVKKINK